LRSFSKKEISRVKEKNLLPFTSDLLDQGGFLGDTAKGASESTARFNLTHHVIRIDDVELKLGSRNGNPMLRKAHDQSRPQQGRDSFPLHYSTPPPFHANVILAVPLWKSMSYS
jgi:hypothetical protein